MFLAKVIRRGFSSSTGAVSKTPFYNLHNDFNGKMVNFSNFLLPVQYEGATIPESHLWTRKNVSIFDVSHMLQTHISGSASTQALESVTTANLRDLPIGQSKLTMFVHQETGGILDDLIVTRTGASDFYVVTNAGCRDQDMAIFLDLKINYNLHVDFLTQNGLLAIQGPKSGALLKKVFPKFDWNELYFMNSTTIPGFDGKSVPGIRVTRCGYTGEDGFEVSLPESICEQFLSKILKEPEVKLAGLGARDTLRLEAGLCLYGSDMDKTTTPREAVLSWLVDKRRIAEKSLPPAILQPPSFLTRKRVGFLVESNAGQSGKAQPIPRAGMDVVCGADNQKVGVVTSGALSPSLTELRGKQISVGMAYLNFKSEAELKDRFKIGQEIGIKIRNTIQLAKITKMPFVNSNYFVKN